MLLCFRTSKDIKMERERLRQERLSNSQKPWQTDGWCDSLRRPERSRDLISQLLETSDQTLRLSEFSRLAGAGARTAFSVPGAETDSSQLISASAGTAGAADSCDAMNGPRTQREERIIPITLTTDQDQDQVPRLGVTRERIIPVMVEVESSDSSTEQCESSSTQSNDSTPEEEIRPSPAFSSLLAEMKISDPSLPLIKPGRTAFHHPSFANHFGFSRLRPEDNKALFAGVHQPGGIRDSFPGFPSFGNFPSFTPLLQGERQFPTRLRDKSRAAAIHKQRLAKSKSSVDSVDCNPSDKQTPQSFR